MRRPENLILHELIGLEVEVLKHSDPSKVGIVGEVVDETKNTFKLLTERGIVIIPKATGLFKFKVKGASVIVEGEVLRYRPEERIKKGMKLLRRFR